MAGPYLPSSEDIAAHRLALPCAWCGWPAAWAADRADDGDVPLCGWCCWPRVPLWTRAAAWLLGIWVRLTVKAPPS
jgi:hypothetical protein